MLPHEQQARVPWDQPQKKKETVIFAIEMKRINWCSNICGNSTRPPLTPCFSNIRGWGRQLFSCPTTNYDMKMIPWTCRGHSSHCTCLTMSQDSTVHRYRQLGSDPRPNMNQALWLIWQVLCPYISSSCFCMFSSYWSALWHEATRVINSGVASRSNPVISPTRELFLCHTLPPSCSTDTSFLPKESV